MTERVTKPRQRKKREARAAIVIREDVVKELPAAATQAVIFKQERIETSPLHAVPYPKQKPAPIERPQREWENAIAAIRWQFKLPTIYQPSQASRS
jgi:hypothetical protein